MKSLARRPRDLAIPGRDLGGVHFAMEFLEQQNRRVAGDVVGEDIAVLATGKNVVVIGGGDTGSDCIGTSFRQGAASVLQLELMPKPPLVRMPHNPWPEWPLVLRTSSSQAEQIIAGGQADAVFLARELLRDPYWPLRAARELGQPMTWPVQYLRAAPEGSQPRAASDTERSESYSVK